MQKVGPRYDVIMNMWLGIQSNFFVIPYDKRRRVHTSAIDTCGMDNGKCKIGPSQDLVKSRSREIQV